MRKLIVHMDIGYVGMDAYDALLVPEYFTDEQISEQAYLMAVQHAESYGYYPRDEYDEEDIPEDEEEYWIESIGASWEDYDPEKHDMKRVGGGSFETDFKQMEMVGAV